MLAQAIFFHGLDRRFAFAILSLPGVGESPGRVLVAYACVACAISMWISNTATVAMMFPIGVSLLGALESRAGAALPASFGTALLLSNAFAASIGGLATPVGTPPNLIGLGFIRRELGVDLPFFSWMALGLPIVAVLLSVFDLAPGPPGDLTGAADLVARRGARLPRSRGRGTHFGPSDHRDLLGARAARWSPGRTRPRVRTSAGGGWRDGCGLLFCSDRLAATASRSRGMRR
jgi:sodium-dependent dicarboxylate transporter 2/3/5